MSLDKITINNGTRQAYPSFAEDGYTTSSGLTKRELFAKDILCALISTSPQSQRHGYPEYIEPYHIDELSKIAIQYTDNLLCELSK